MAVTWPISTSGISFRQPWPSTVAREALDALNELNGRASALEGERILDGAATAALTLTATAADVPGASVPFTTVNPGAVAEIEIICDMQTIATPTNTTALGVCNVDGVDQSRQATFGALTGSRATVSQRYTLTLGTGLHVVKMRGLLSGTASSVRINQTHSLVHVRVKGI